MSNHLGVLGSLFEDAVKWRYAVHNPVRQVKPCRVDRVDEDFDFWTAEESERFLAAIREVLDNNRVKHPFWRGIEKAGVRRFRIHDLRHSFASLAGESLFKVRRLLGHSEATMTQRYAHLRAEDLGESVGVLDNAGNSAAHLRHIGRGEGV